MPVEIKALSVTLLNRQIKEMFEDNLFLSNIIVEGEISNFKLNSSGHIYFTLKDQDSQISCVMFRSYTQQLKFMPKNGDKVYVRGTVSVYEKGGSYQILCSAMKEKGLGDLYQKYEELKRKLEGKGYFDSRRKRPLPKFPKNIALLTSPTGAVIEDMKSIILKRSRFSNLTLYPMKVQGEDAKYDIVKKIRLANENPEIDLIILARGGGSIEDLWAFNEEIVADAIFNSEKPIISAIGHETDFTISDFTADLRAATPSDAALIAVRDNNELLTSLTHLYQRLTNSYIETIRRRKMRLDSLMESRIMKDPINVLYKKRNLLDNLSLRLDSVSPKERLLKEREILSNASYRLNVSYRRLIESLKTRYRIGNEKLALLNPLSVLDKGYSITYYNDSSLKSVESVNDGDIIKTRLKDGLLESKIIKKESLNDGK